MYIYVNICKMFRKVLGTRTSVWGDTCAGVHAMSLLPTLCLECFPPSLQESGGSAVAEFPEGRTDGGRRTSDHSPARVPSSRRALHTAP